MGITFTVGDEKKPKYNIWLTGICSGIIREELDPLYFIVRVHLLSNANSRIVLYSSHNETLLDVEGGVVFALFAYACNVTRCTCCRTRIQRRYCSIRVT